jgi:lipoate---protein ligase
VRAVRSLGINAHANERNDVCIGDEKMSPLIYMHLQIPEVETIFFVFHVSGSAYKLVSHRAYHHGTMLISTRLDNLKDLLRSNKVSGL